MTDNIEKEGIRRAIDRFQKEHPCHLTFDVTLFDNGTDFTVMQRAIDMVAKKCQEDADIHIICEMAKLYLEGVRPMVKPKHEWIPCSERMPEHGEQVLLWVKEKGDRPLSIKPDYHVGRLDHMNGDPDGKSNFWGIPVKPCEWRMQGWSYFFEPDVLAWMPLPEPYREEASE